MKLIVIGVLLTLSLSSASASYLTGVQLLKECEQETDACIGYIMGAIDNVALLQEMELIAYNICVPNAVTPVELAQIVDKGFKTRTADLQQPASFLLVQVLGGTFPCKAAQ